MMCQQVLVFLVFACLAVLNVESNREVDILNTWKTILVDPNNVLQSWDPTLVNPCTWFHVTCNLQNSVVRLDLGNANLSGVLVPQLGMLTNLQYLEVYANKLSGHIPSQFGNLKSLVSLDLEQNLLSGSIPPTLGNLKSLRYLRLNSNNLTGEIPPQVIQLPYSGNLMIMNVSDNYLKGTDHHHNKTGFAIATIIQDPKPLKAN